MSVARAGSVASEARIGALDVEELRAQFPILTQKVRGKPLVYLDNAATSQKPQRVIDRISDYYRGENSNIHRGVHYLSQLATLEYEHVREQVRQFINAEHLEEIVFVRGTTEAINLVSNSYGRQAVGAGDEVIISAMEHHSNIVPWQMLCDSVGAKLRVAPIDRTGELLVDEFRRLISARTKLVAVGHVSNALGTINPVKELVEIAHGEGVPVLIDGAQAAPHLKVDVQDIGCDFYAFSSHKMYGPTGIGVLYGRKQLLESMPPYQGGGDMIASVTFEKTVYNVLPHKFEAGTPDIAGVIGLGAAIDFMNDVGVDAIAAHEHELLMYATEQLQKLEQVRLIGTAANKAAVISFVVEGIHPHDIGTILDDDGIAVRTGHHCVQPVMDFFGVPATARASFACYNTFEEVDTLVRGLKRVIEVFS